MSWYDKLIRSYPSAPHYSSNQTGGGSFEVQTEREGALTVSNHHLVNKEKISSKIELATVQNVELLLNPKSPTLQQRQHVDQREPCRRANNCQWQDNIDELVSSYS